MVASEEASKAEQEQEQVESNPQPSSSNLSNLKEHNSSSNTASPVTIVEENGVDGGDSKGEAEEVGDQTTIISTSTSQSQQNHQQPPPQASSLSNPQSVKSEVQASTSQSSSTAAPVVAPPTPLTGAFPQSSIIPAITQPSTSTSTIPSKPQEEKKDQPPKHETALDSIQTHDFEWEEGSEEAIEELDDDDEHDVKPIRKGDEDEEEQKPIQAYAKLEFPGFSYYVQTLDVSIGRRPAHLPPENSTQSQHLTGEPLAPGDVDVDLGPLKSISRLHAKIYYQPAASQTDATHYNIGRTSLESSRLFSYKNSMANGHEYDPNAGVVPSATHSARNSPTPSGMETPGNYNYWTNGGQEGRFVLELMGRNGAFVDDLWVGKGGIVPLGRR